ncbi:quinate utilization oxidoreductase [Diplodia corticola]|uniref:Quinate utilization oxidoreductase n=1 Tax=Diplodia corticola TaxID=236234 RepID=A0A1J9RJG8_9PEZI|nr:quinate utilization oxidoreductase [Diplodia corticola]OJD28679.1 quinate utilization oxidoreductase [Diplodia corticola]
MAPAPPLKIAIIGAGLIGPRHANTVVQDPNAALACIVDPSPAAKQVAATLQTPLYPSVQAMLSSPHRPDAAIVCTPNHTHVPVSTELLSSGIHVLCEKPISTSIASGQALVDLASRRNLHLLIGHHRRFNPFVVATKRILAHPTHSLGQITAVSGLWTLRKPPAYYDAPAAWRQSASSGGPVLINLIHDIDVLHHLLGPVVGVAAFEAAKRRGHAAEEGGAIILRFASGVVGTFVLCDAVASPHAFELATGENPLFPPTSADVYRIFGTEATLSVPDLGRWAYASGREKSWRSEMVRETLKLEELLGEDERTKAPFELQVEHLVRVVRGEASPVCSGADGLAAVRVAEAVREALRTVGVVHVNQDRPKL